MYVIMNNYFWSSLVNDYAVRIFILCSYLLPVQPSNFFSWEPVITDLEELITENPPKIDTSLYTANVNYPRHCDISVLECFCLEMETLLYEASITGDKEFYHNVHRITRSVGRFLDGKNGKETPKCRECETFEEKQYTEFMQNFKTIAQRFYREEKQK